MRFAGIFLLLSLPLWGDVVILKTGVRVAGRVTEKGTHYEVMVDGVLHTYLKEEVERVVTSPKEFLGDSDKFYEEAKADYQKAVAMASPAEQQALIKAAIAKITRAREGYASAMDLFPDDDKVGRQLMLVMQLMRLLRERVGSEMARPAAPAPARAAVPAPAAATPPPADDAAAVLVTPALRGDAGRRTSARNSFRSRRPAEGDLAVAAALFLARSDAEMKLEGAALKAAQEYFEKPWIKEGGALPPEKHLEAGLFLSERLAAWRGRPETAPAAEALFPFAVAHLGAAPPGPGVDAAARAAGLAVQDGRVGTIEGHVVRDLNGWIATGDFDLAVLAFVKEYRAVDTPSVRFVWSYALLRLVEAKKRGFERPADAFLTIKGSSQANDHVAALVKSIRAVANCTTCGGEGRLRCTNCHGKKNIVFQCTKCEGKGHWINQFGTQLNCLPCKSTGNVKALVCRKCADGYFDCKQCDKPRTAPRLEEIVDERPCEECDGRGLQFRGAALPCRSCLGLGRRLVPRSDPSKVLP